MTRYAAGMGTQVVTRSGTVEGVEKAGVIQFRGVPFAAPPVGENRFRPPTPARPWTGVQMADTFKPMAAQVKAAAGLSLLPGPEKLDWSEDCLYLNVFTPATDGDPRPGMVWIHGGGFTGGSSRDAWYNGTSFAHKGVVVVTVAYRLGALGFLHLGADFPGSGNLGILDQVAALEWVRDNIGAFGGDPANVTIFGESAGGMSVATLLGTPSAAGLFHRAIPQSGAASFVQPVDTASELAERMRTAVGGDLSGAPAEKILEAQVRVIAESVEEAGLRLPFRPVVDGDVLPRPPLDAVKGGDVSGVAIVTGTTRDEMTLFLAASPRFSDIDEAGVVRRVGQSLYDTYREAMGAVSPRDIWVAVESDRVFRIPAIHMAEAQSAHTADVWMYLFTWGSPLLGGALGACHALEIPFVWNTLSVRGTDQFCGRGAEADALSSAMHEAWVAFASTGDPGWDRYESDRRATMVFGPDGGVVKDPLPVWSLA